MASDAAARSSSAITCTAINKIPLFHKPMINAVQAGNIEGKLILIGLKEGTECVP